MNGFTSISLGRRIGALTAALSVLALVIAPSALAAGSSVKGYGGAGGSVQSTLQSSSDPTASSAAAGSLPFTGLELIVALVGGLLLLGAGVLVAHLTPPTASDRRA